MGRIEPGSIPQGSDYRHVAECGKCDALVPGKRLIPAVMDQANGLPDDPLKPAQGQGRAASSTTISPFSRPHLQGRSLPDLFLDLVTLYAQLFGLLTEFVELRRRAVSVKVGRSFGEVAEAPRLKPSATTWSM
jgi:hypothetical protein